MGERGLFGLACHARKEGGQTIEHKALPSPQMMKMSSFASNARGSESLSRVAVPQRGKRGGGTLNEILPWFRGVNLVVRRTFAGFAALGSGDPNTV